MNDAALPGNDLKPNKSVPGEPEPAQDLPRDAPPTRVVSEPTEIVNKRSPGLGAGYIFTHIHSDRLPRLGWIAQLPLTPGTIDVVHGDWVETGDGWLVEGAWDGPLEGGDFDRSCCFFGSGIRLRNATVQIVASRATVDNLFYVQTAGKVIASNSLLLLLSETGARLDTQHSYEREFSGALKGIRNYKKEIPVIHETIQEICQLYFGNLTIESGCVEPELPANPEHFSTYHQYSSFLIEKMKALHANATSAKRKHPMQCYATLSTGYDSSAVAVLANRHCGIDVCVTTNPETSGPTPLEDARPLAEKLGMKTILIDAPAEGLGDRELYYYAGTFQHFEMIFDKATRIFEANESPTLLLTGYHGDKVWDKNLPEAYWSDELKRGDMSGKGLGEIRLKSGFINAAIPFLGAREIAQIVAISRSAEMAPWSVGGDYDRPIPRRICEDAGLTRESFGQQKHKITSHKARPPDRDLQRAFTQGLKDDFAIGAGRRLLVEILDRLAYRLHGLAFFDFLTDWKRSLLFGKPHLRMVLFIWAVNRAADQMKRDGLR